MRVQRCKTVLVTALLMAVLTVWVQSQRKEVTLRFRFAEENLMQRSIVINAAKGGITFASQKQLNFGAFQRWTGGFQLERGWGLEGRELQGHLGFSFARHS